MSDRDSHPLKVGLPPIVDSSTRILILGSLPSDQSIEARQYYANPRNHFWQIIYASLGAGAPALEYDDRLCFVRSVGIGLWDVMQSATRTGSSDLNISDEIANDLPGLLRQYPQIQRVLANGTKARDCYARHYRDARLPAIYAPSSSPTGGRNVVPWEQRVPRWRDALCICDPSNNGIHPTSQSLD